MSSDNQNITRDPRIWILPLRRHETPISRLKRQVAAILEVPSSRLYMTIGEYEKLHWMQDSAIIDKVLDAIRKDKADGRLDKLCKLIDDDNEWEDRHLLMLHDFLMDAYQRVK